MEHKKKGWMHLLSGVAPQWPPFTVFHALHHPAAKWERACECGKSHWELLCYSIWRWSPWITQPSYRGETEAHGRNLPWSVPEMAFEFRQSSWSHVLNPLQVQVLGRPKSLHSVMSSETGEATKPTWGHISCFQELRAGGAGGFYRMWPPRNSVSMCKRCT